MNTSVNIVNGEFVKLSCLLKYKSHFQSSLEDVRIMIEHAGSDVMINETQTSEARLDAILKVKTSRNTEEPTVFGPVKCTFEFIPQVNDSEFAQNQVHFDSNEISASYIQCKFLHLSYICYLICAYLQSILSCDFKYFNAVKSCNFYLCL